MKNAEEILINYLKNALVDVDVLAEQENKRRQNSERFVIVEGLGGKYDDYTEVQDVAFTCYAHAKTKYEASCLAYKILDVSRGIADNQEEVCSASFGLPQDCSDKQYKYKININLKIKE